MLFYNDFLKRGFQIYYTVIYFFGTCNKTFIFFNLQITLRIIIHKTYVPGIHEQIKLNFKDIFSE